MIPHIAFFYWSGGSGPLPWLREQALISFQRCHPTWEVVLGVTEPHSAPLGVRVVLDDISNPALPAAARSDVWRWYVLSKYGGVYADTDVIFIHSIEPLFQEERDAWLTFDMGTPIWHCGRMRGTDGRVRAKVNISIGVLAAASGSVFFNSLYTVSRTEARSENYQSHGTCLIAKHWNTISRGVQFGGIPSEAFYRGSSRNQVRPLWTETGKFSEEEIGLHWYGGSEESKPFLNVKSAAELPECWVRKALERRT